MKLIDLEPRFIQGNEVFIFLCPHCQDIYLVCKSIQMSEQDQHDLLERLYGENWNTMFVPAKAETCWSFGGTNPGYDKAFIEDLTVTPSIDASASGHWHGFITKGEIV